MKYYVLTYDRRAGGARIRKIYSSAHRADAMRKRFALEASEGAANADLEVVVLGAESEDMLRKTHGRYFSSTKTLVDELSSAV